MTKNAVAKTWSLPLVGGVRYSAGAPEFPDDPITLPSRWLFLGDSQTGGRASETPSAESPIIAFNNIWDENGLTPSSTTQTVNGIGGRSLQGTADYYDTVSIASTPWVHTQESGGQDEGQTTPSEFGDTFQAYIEKIYLDWPDAIVSYETAFSFGREAESGRNWGPYNEELISRIALLESNGQPVILVDTDTYIKLLQAELTPADVWYQSGEANAYHYRGLGNFMIAMLMLRELGHDVTSLTHSSIELDTDDKALVVSLLS